MYARWEKKAICAYRTSPSTVHPKPIACFVNCTTGNNCTSPFTRILFSLLHIIAEQIVTDYELSDKELTVVARLGKNPKFATAFGDEVEKRVMRIVSARLETMSAMFEMVSQREVSSEGYKKMECRLTDE